MTLPSDLAGDNAGDLAGGASDPRPQVRIAAVLRRAITTGAIPPGAHLDLGDIGRRFWAPANAAVKAVSLLRGEQLVIWYKYNWYAAPAGSPDSAASTRLGATLARMRTAAGMTNDEFAQATGSVRRSGRPFYIHPDAIPAAEAGTWYPRAFWESCDTALNADGTLLRLHDSTYAARSIASDSDFPAQDAGEYLPPPPPPGLHPAVARVAAEISARVSAGHWPPGTPLPAQSVLAREHSANSSFVCQALMELAGQGILIRFPGFGYLTPLPDQAPIRSVISVVLEWDDGTHTRLTCTPAHQPPASPPGTVPPT